MMIIEPCPLFAYDLLCCVVGGLGTYIDKGVVFQTSFLLT